MSEKQQSNIDGGKDEKLNKVSWQLLSISQGTSTVIGKRFFENLSQCLAAAFHVRYAFIGKVIDFEKNIAQMHPLWDDVEKEFNNSIVWYLKNTPCEDVVLGEIRLVPNNVQESYPLAPILKKFNIESYFGIPLISSSGKRLGLISVMDNKPMTDTRNYEPIIQIFADRCSSEMERLEIDSKLKEASISKKRSEDYLSTIANNTSSVIYMKNLEGRYLFINKRWENIFNVTRHEVIGKTDLDLFPKEVAEKFIKNDEQIMQSGETFEGEEFAPHDDGVHTYISIKAPLKDSDGMVYGICGVSTDISDRKKMEDKIKRSNEELESFASIASHDLQEPLRKISLFGERLKDLSPDLDDKSTEYLTKMTNAAERMKNLIDDLLSFSKVTIKSQPFEQVDLNFVAKESLGNLDILIRETKGTVKWDNLPTILGDSFQMEQLFQNLISNSLKYHQDDIPPVIKIYSKQTNKNQLEICFDDNGIGFEEKYVEKIFQPFQRLHGRNEFSGTGIGLAICQKIIDYHSGSIKVKSVPNKGSTFIITFQISRSA
jgi:PAS domain S-box-containing protein